MEHSTYMAIAAALTATLHTGHIMTHKASIGSISHGTLQVEDLISAFAGELERLSPGHALVVKAKAVATLYENGWSEIYNSPEASTLLDGELFNALDELAPPYCYFGTIEGDGADFGFWPDLEAIGELPKVADPSEVPTGATGEDCVFVNDHGNVTVYGADGSVLLEVV